MLRVVSIGIVSGASLTHCLGFLPDTDTLLIPAMTVVVCLVAGVWLARRDANMFSKRCTDRLVLVLFVLLSSVMCAMTWTVFQAQSRLKDSLSPSLENVVTRVTYLVQSMSQDQSELQRFEAQVLDPLPPGMPRNILVSWQDTQANRVTVLPGQTWRAALVLRRPHGASNPSGFDYESHMFQKNIRALGKVRGRPKLLSDHPYASMRVMVSRIRHNIRQSMRNVLGDARYAPVLIALAIGDQDSVSAADWDIFNRTGITHLVSISGSHVTMLAAFGGVSMMWLWKRIRFTRRHACEMIPSKVMAACAALLIAFLYCLLAGWGVPARRTFFMLLVIGMAMIARLSISPTAILGTAAAVVTVLDPWSPLATGFWLSFGAVLVLFAVGAQALKARTGRSAFKKTWFLIRESARMQWLITLAMLPVLAFLFQQVSLVSPFANAIAIPVVTFIVTPFALLTGIFCVIPGFDGVAYFFGYLANFSMQWAMYPIIWLAQAKWSMFSVAAMPVWLLILSLAGVAWALLPPGVPVRWAGWCLLFPALVWRPDRPEQGAWRMVALDVGQGSAILVSTKHHDLLFDTGPRSGQTDAAQRVINPVMRALAIHKIDTLVVSHADMDHVGGLAHILKTNVVKNIYASFDVQAWLDHKKYMPMESGVNTENISTLRCERGQKWSWDGVLFTMLHPLDSNSTAAKKNAGSCVLHIEGKFHSALLPGDIGETEEKTLTLSSHALKADVVIVAHHGSTSSSSAPFVRQINAHHAIAQLGHLNRFKHPDPQVVDRWQKSNTTFWRSDQQGAIHVLSTALGLDVYSYRAVQNRYWTLQFKTPER